MQLQQLTLQRVRSFVQAAEEEGFRTAARRLHLSEPTLVGHIHDLEKALDNAKLFNTRGQHATLTAIGRQLLPRARTVMESAERLLEYCGDLTSGLDGVVSIACYPV